MARTAPVPNIPPVPGMCPSVAVLGGGGAGGGGSGDGTGDGSGDGPDNGQGTGDDASGDGRNGGCAEGDPVCPITGRIFIQFFDFGFGGPLPLRWVRFYNSRLGTTSFDLGKGWTHSFGWRIVERRAEVWLYDDQMRKHVLPKPPVGASIITGLGYEVAQADGSYVVRTNAHVLRFSKGDPEDIHLLASISDRNQNAITLTRDSSGTLTELIDSAGRAYRISSDGAKRLSRIDIALNAERSDWMEVARYTYDDTGHLIGCTDAESFTDGYAYEGDLLTRHRSPSGLTYFYLYDGTTSASRCIETWGEFPGETDAALDPRPARRGKGIHYRKFDYDPVGRYSEVETGIGGLVRYFGDEAGRGIKIIDAAGVTERTFDPVTGSFVAETGPEGITAVTSPTTPGFIPEVVRPDATDARGIRRWPDGTREVISDELSGGVSYAKRDARGNLLEYYFADGTQEHFQVDPKGLITHYVGRDGRTIRVRYDAMGNAVETDYGGGRVTFSAWDYLGRLIAHQDESGGTTEWRYDRRSEIVWKKLPDGSEIHVVRDANRNIVEYRHGSRTTRNTYGGMGWLSSRTHPGGRTDAWQYDSEGNLTRVSNSRGQHFELVYDTVGRCVEWTNFEGIRSTQSFAGTRRKSLSTQLGKHNLEYNAKGELAELAMPDGTSVILAYDASARMKCEFAGVKEEIARDAMGRVAHVELHGAGLSVNYLGGEVSLISGQGVDIAYRYDRVGALCGITAGQAELALGKFEGDTVVDRVSDRLQIRRRCDRMGRVLARSVERLAETIEGHLAPVELHRTNYTYDADGYLVSERSTDQIDKEYEVDRAGQIVAFRTVIGGKTVREEKVSYDAAGTVRLPGVLFDAHTRPVKHVNESLEYDSLGRLTKRLGDAGETRYHYNALDHLVRVELPGRKVVTMQYDALGRRVGKQVVVAKKMTKRIRYVYAENLLLHEIDDLRKTTRTYLRRMEKWDTYGHVDRHKDGSEDYAIYVLAPNGSADFAVDPTGKVIWRMDRALFGEVVQSVVADCRVDLRFMNQFYDEDVELTYNLMRWYDARVGMFTTLDPAVAQGNSNPRDYAANPLREIDPSGLFTFTTGPAGGDAGHHPTPVPNGTDDVGPRTTGASTTHGRTAADAPALSGPGNFAVGSAGANGNPTPGFANCPPNLLDSPGPFGAENGATSPQGIVNRAGAAYGCHTCGARTSGYSSNGGNHWTCDHIPPRSAFGSDAASRAGSGPRARHESGATGVAGTAGAVRLYPQCRRCSDAQRNALSAESSGGTTAASSRALPRMRGNAGTTTPL